MTDDNELLRRFAQERSESAFSELVSRHLNLVYSAALRQVDGDQELARDVAQTVFIDLARKAKSVAGHESIPAWLYKSARYAASAVRRSETRRKNRELTVVMMAEQSSEPSADWPSIAPVLDDAISQLG